MFCFQVKMFHQCVDIEDGMNCFALFSLFSSGNAPQVWCKLLMFSKRSCRDWKPTLSQDEYARGQRGHFLLSIKQDMSTLDGKLCYQI